MSWECERGNVRVGMNVGMNLGIHERFCWGMGTF